MIPEKWCLRITRENLEFCKNLENKELGFQKGYIYTIGGYYSSVVDSNGAKGSLNLEDRIEITLEQFQEHILNQLKQLKLTMNI